MKYETIPTQGAQEYPPLEAGSIYARMDEVITNAESRTDEPEEVQWERFFHARNAISSKDMDTQNLRAEFLWEKDVMRLANEYRDVVPAGLARYAQKAGTSNVAALERKLREEREAHTVLGGEVSYREAA